MRTRGAERRDVVANTHPENRAVELASGIDALYLSGRGELLAGTLDRFEERRCSAEDMDLAAPCRGRAPHVLRGPARLGQVPLLPAPPHRPYRSHLEHLPSCSSGTAPFRVHPRCRTDPGRGHL